MSGFVGEIGCYEYNPQDENIYHYSLVRDEMI